MKKRLLKLASMAGLILSSQGVFSFSPTNFALPHEGYLWTSSKYLLPDYYDKDDPKSFRLNVGTIVEYGFDSKGVDKNSDEVNPYKIYYPSENLLDAELTKAGKNQLMVFGNMALLANNNSDSTDPSSGIRYQMDDNVKFREWDMTLWSRLALPVESMPGQLELSAYLPIKYFDVTNVSWSPLSQSNPLIPPVGAISYMDSTELLNLLDTSKMNINSWHESGLGDINIFASWKNHYTQVNDALSSVGIYAQIGLSLPTSYNSKSLDNALSVPFGYDGALAIPMSAAINLNFSKNFRLCGSVDAVVPFCEEHLRHIRMKESEGSLWLKDRMSVKRTPGVLLGFNVLGEVISNCKNYSLGVAYSFVKKSEDSLNVSGSAIAIANKSEMALEKSYHNVVFRAGLDLREMVDSSFAPTLSISYKYPLKGQRVILFKSLKIEASINF